MIFFRKRSKTYHVSVDNDEWVTPEDTLVDAGSSLSAVEVPVGEGVFRAATAALVCAVLLLVVAVFRITILRHGYFSQLSLRNKTVNVSVPPPRGIIMDRNGVPLVSNVPSFDLLVVSRQVQHETNGAPEGIGSLASVLETAPEELALFIEDGIKKNAVFFAATDLSRSQVLALRSVLPSGFSIITSTKRQYVNGQQFSHIIGYVGKVSRNDMATDAYYLPSDVIGRLGIEAQYEQVLRGQHGELEFSASDEVSVHAASAGDNVVLALDQAVQKALYNSVWNILRESGLRSAAAIAQDPQSGKVLGMVSFPSYDNNLFNHQLSQADVDELFNNPAHPLLNRAIAGQYNPGSTIKPFIGMTALEESIITPTQIVTNDCIELVIPNPQDPEHPYVYKNWRSDTGVFDLYRAIADSCNIYFFKVGGGYLSFHGLGIQAIATYLHKAFSDLVLGVDLPGEDHGFIPTPEWKYANTKEPWYQGDTYNVSIGQGDLLVTPLWLNTYISAIANGGTLWEPQVVDRIVDDQRNTVRVVESELLGKLPFTSETIQQMQSAMRRTVTVGTAKLLNDLPVSAAAKTGTAEVVKGQRINSFLVVYAPAEHPQIALTVLVEGSTSNQGYALRAARQFLGWYFRK